MFVQGERPAASTSLLETGKEQPQNRLSVPNNTEEEAAICFGFRGCVTNEKRLAEPDPIITVNPAS